METSNSIAIKPNVQIIKEAFGNFLNGNIPAIINICADDVAWGGYKVPDVPFAGMFYGKEGVQDFFKRLAENVDFSYFEPKEFFSQGDDVFVLGHNTGTAKTTGLSFDHGWCMHFRMQGGKLKNYFAYLDSFEQAKAFRQI